MLRRYVHGPGVDEPLVWYEGSGTSDRRYLHADERGSIVAVSDSAGNAIAINKYDEYGRPQGPSGAGTLLGRFGYTGQAWLPEIQLYYYKARMYDPKLGGRFMQTDPAGYGPGMNLYVYPTDPVNLIDPSGMQPELIIVTATRREEPIVITGDRCRVFDCSAGDRLNVISSPGSIAHRGRENSERQGNSIPNKAKPPTRTKKPKPKADKHRSECVAVVAGSSAFLLTHATPHTVRVGTEVFRGMLLGGRLGAAAGGGLFSLHGIVIGAVVGGVVYYLDQRTNNAGADALGTAC